MLVSAYFQVFPYVQGLFPHFCKPFLSNPLCFTHLDADPSYSNKEQITKPFTDSYGGVFSFHHISFGKKRHAQIKDIKHEEYVEKGGARGERVMEIVIV